MLNLTGLVQQPELYTVYDNGIFPNSIYPVIHYRSAFTVPLLFGAAVARSHFKRNNWGNNWRAGIYTVHHYHSNTHEVMAVIKGETRLLLGGDNGLAINIRKGDVLIIPAGVAHKNMCREKDVTCIGGYPGGAEYDMNYGRPGERPGTDRNIASLNIPPADPLLGAGRGLVKIWSRI